jgi:uncharacterized protein (DUF1684 family)
VTVGDYERRIDAMRRQKDEAFKYDAGSPLPPEDRAGFEGLAYFPAASAWRVEAKVTRMAGSAPFEMATSTGEPRLQRRAARLDFETPAGKATLFAYEDASGHDHHHGPPTYFVPFRDRTSGKETYGAGRYLDLDVPSGDRLVVDLNLAYNPYCAYSPAYSCPLPPPENWLEIPVVAGEKQYGKENA